MQYFLPILLATIALLLLWLSQRQRRDLGIPSGQVLYSDMTTNDRLKQPLYDAKLDLVGRPDYLIEQLGELIPVEVKSGRTPRSPYDSHVHQLAAYCMLVSSQFGQRPTHGLIRYPQKSFRIEFTEELERQTLALISQMRAALDLGQVDRSHNHAARCHACGFLEICDQSL
jgi:CRISPR-associated exonuclease Cas4